MVKDLDIFLSANLTSSSHKVFYKYKCHLFMSCIRITGCIKQRLTKNLLRETTMVYVVLFKYVLSLLKLHSEQLILFVTILIQFIVQKIYNCKNYF